MTIKHKYWTGSEMQLIVPFMTLSIIMTGCCYGSPQVSSVSTTHD